jgi:DNA-binding MarR family transcriptional regulator
LNSSLRLLISVLQVFLVSLLYHLRMTSLDERWRNTHLGHWLRLALEKFDRRVAALLVHNAGTPLALANLVARDQLGAAHIHVTRHLAREGTRLTDLARSAGMTKQAMGALVSQCEAWGMVTREADPLDARARLVRYTTTGLAWLEAYRQSVQQAQEEMRAAIGDEVATVITLGLDAYSAQ